MTEPIVLPSVIPSPVPHQLAVDLITVAGGDKDCAERLHINQRTVMRWRVGSYVMPWASAQLIANWHNQTIPNLTVDIVSE